VLLLVLAGPCAACTGLTVDGMVGVMQGQPCVRSQLPLTVVRCFIGVTVGACSYGCQVLTTNAFFQFTAKVTLGSEGRKGQNCAVWRALFIER
jgi:hypothetical protein